jgi:hypothetical protein
MLKEQEMMTRREVKTALSTGILIAATQGLSAQERALKELPPARVEGGKPLVEALRLRRSIREYSERSLPAQILSDLLWAAYGINRPSGDRTAPYWRHIMVIDVYAAMADGGWLYTMILSDTRCCRTSDIRPATGLQDFVATPPLNLVYVAVTHWRTCELDFTTSFHNPTDFVRCPSSAKARWHHGELSISLPVATAPRIGYRFNVQENWQ